MKIVFDRSDVVFCSELVKKGFLLMGYKYEEERIAIFCQSLLKAWKKEWPRWDRNDLSRHFNSIIEAGHIERLVVPQVLPGLRNIYRAHKEPSKPCQLPTDRLEKEYIEEVVQRIINKRYFEEKRIWRQLSLFYIPLAICQSLLPAGILDEYHRLKGVISQKVPGNLPSKVQMRNQLRGSTAPQNPKPEVSEILKLGNHALRIMIEQSDKSIPLLKAELKRRQS